MIRRIMFVLALVLFLAALVSAQEGEPVPLPVIPTLTATPTALPATASPTAAATLDVTTDRLLFAPQVEVAFPAGVRFQIRVIAPAEAVTAASLTLERLGQPPQTTDLDLSVAALPAGEFTDLSYVWEMTPEAYPAFFEPINFRWTVRTTGEVNTARGQFQFTDQRLIWETAATQNGNLSLVMPLDQGVERLVDVMGQVGDTLEANTGIPQAFRFIVYEQALDPLGCVVGEDDVPYAFTTSGFAIRCLDRSLAERIFDASGMEVLRVRSYTQADMQDALNVTLFDRYYRPLWESQAVPEWFAYGLTQIVAPTNQSDLLVVAQNAARGNRLFSLSEMATLPNDPAAQRDWQAQSLAMVLYTVDRIGFPELFRLARALGSAPFVEQYQAVAAQPLSALVPSMRDWLFTARADAAFRVSIYAEATSTLAPSATRTPFPPTRTPRPQPSATLTATITLTPSPRPTATPTSTVTPRPPGSLATPTPAVAAPSTPLLNSTAQTSIIAIIGIILTVLIILFARVGRR